MLVSDQDQKTNSNSTIILETPPMPDLPSQEVGDFLANAETSNLSSKVMFAESLLDLLVKDYSFHDFMREILVLIMKLIKCEAGSLLEVDETKNVLFFRAVVGCSSDRVTKFYIPLGKGLVGEVVETRQPVIFNKMEDNHTYLKSIEDAVGFKAKNVAATPIVIRSRIFGVIELLNRTSDEGFSQQDIDFLVYTTQLAARAIEARLILNWAMQNQPISQQKAA